ncbi:hypothetical protein SKAU_G00314600 [Synaphobranchus kaupii]|uniref:Uncharacterized protein n=1 Tax=Synaphobranchus kaupii TaxID=118154 RepID=A0A9Q1ESD7_SYNKA|nr:hypothetical protein SKAU_G00314600 [Synaphobranchus kaupii]
MTVVWRTHRGRALLFGAADGHLLQCSPSPARRGGAGPKPVTPLGPTKGGGGGPASTFRPPEKKNGENKGRFTCGFGAMGRAKDDGGAAGLVGTAGGVACPITAPSGRRIRRGSGQPPREKARRAPVQQRRARGGNPTDGRRCTGPTPGSAPGSGPAKPPALLLAVLLKADVWKQIVQANRASLVRKCRANKSQYDPHRRGGKRTFLPSHVTQHALCSADAPATATAQRTRKTRQDEYACEQESSQERETFKQPWKACVASGSRAGTTLRLGRVSTGS